MRKKNTAARRANTKQAAAEVRVGAVEASEFRLVDRNGQVRAVLEMSRSGPGLSMLYEDGTLALEISLSPAGPSIRLNEQAGNTRVFIGATRGGARVGLSDTDSAPRAFLGVSATGEPSLTFYDAKQKSTWKAGQG